VTYLYSTFKLLFENNLEKRYEEKYILKEYIQSQYGIFKKKNKYFDSETFYQKIISEARPYLDTTTHLLDVGCATGRLVFEFEKLGVQSCTGIDKSKLFINFCHAVQNGLTKLSFEPTTPSKSIFLNEDIFKPTIPSSYFNFISCINVLDRVDDPKKLISKLHELLSISGVVLISTPYDWALSPASVDKRISDITPLLNLDLWSIEKEIHNVAYVIPGKTYNCHFLILKKRCSL
jgi:2-polyprenyl-3-methyl-5-hydroxy-6-metoxy-1,4-benzoquinol methylase